MRVAFAGTPSVAIPTLRALLDSSHEVVIVISQPPAPRGRSGKPLPSEVAEFALQNDLEVITPESINEIETIELLQTKNIDIAVVVAYGQLLKSDALATFEKGWINAHFSLLPAWRGAAPVQAAIIHGDELTGVTTFQLESGMDSGPILGQVTTEITNTETAGELLERLSVLGADLVVKTLDAIESGQARPQVQSLDDVSYASKVHSNDAKVNWRNPALAISRHIRGFSPNPGAWTLLDGARIELAKIEITETQDLQPGKFQLQKSFVKVGTGSTDIKLSQVKPAGKGWMDAAAWVRGLRNSSEEFTSG